MDEDEDFDVDEMMERSGYFEDDYSEHDRERAERFERVDEYWDYVNSLESD